MADDHSIEWLTPAGTPAKARGKNSVESTVSHLWAVRQELRNRSLAMALAADLLLRAHTKTGAAHIEVVHAPPTDLDSYVQLVDADPGGNGKPGNRAFRSSMSIEFGWTQTHAFGKKLARPIRHEGLHILRTVMRQAIRRYGRTD